MAPASVVHGKAALAVDVAGDGDAVVFLHAGVADRRSWAGVTDRLPDWRTVTYDRRGFGTTTYEPEAFAHVDDLVAVLDGLGIERAVLVGNSQGGRIAIDAALAHPQRVRALFLIAPAVSGEPEPEVTPDLQAISDAIDAAEEAGDLARLNELEAELWLDGPAGPAGRVAGEARALFLDMNRIALHAVDPGEAHQPPPAVGRLDEVAVPTRLLVGELDLGFIRERVTRLAATIPWAVAEVVPGVAHLPMLEDPALVADRLSTFLTTLPR